MRREDQVDTPMVDRILQHKQDPATLQHQFKIRWAGFTEEDDTWEDARYILSVDRVKVDSFLDRMTTGSRKKESLLDYLEMEE